MDRERISNSIAQMLLSEDIGPLTPAVDFYNHWAQTERIMITDPDIAFWALGLIKSLLATDKKLLTSFVYNPLEAYDNENEKPVVNHR